MGLEAALLLTSAAKRGMRWPLISKGSLDQPPSTFGFSAMHSANKAMTTRAPLSFGTIASAVGRRAILAVRGHHDGALSALSAVRERVDGRLEGLRRVGEPALPLQPSDRRADGLRFARDRENPSTGAAAPLPKYSPFPNSISPKRAPPTP